MAVSDEALGQVLEALVSAGGASETLPPAPGVEPSEGMQVARELLRRRWIEAEATLRGDGELSTLREIRVTEGGHEALRQLRATVGRPLMPQPRVTPLEEKRRQRLLFMRRLYELTDGSQSVTLNMWQLGEELGWDRSDVDHVIEYLEGEGLLEFVAMGGAIAITHVGVVEVEQTLSDPEVATVHFPAAVNVIHVEQMHGSQIQQGTSDSSQVGRFVSQDTSRALHDLIASLRGDLGDITLDDEDRAELDAELGTVEQQLKSPRPKAGIVRSSIDQVAHLLGRATVATGSAVELATHIDKLHKILPGI